MLNQSGVPKRSEVGLGGIGTVLNGSPACVIDFDPKLFRTAGSRGMMIAEADPKGKAARQFAQLAQELAGPQGRTAARLLAREPVPALRRRQSLPL